MAQIKSFTFTCEFKEPREMSKLMSSDDNKGWKRLNFPVTDGNSVQFLDLFGMPFTTFKTYVKDGEKSSKEVTVKWEDRFNPSIVDQVVSYCKYILDLGERQEFITEYDFLVALHDAVLNGKVQGQKLYIRGQIVFQKYNGQVQRRFKPQFISYAKGDTLSFDGEISFVFDSESLDMESGKEKSQVYVDGYVLDYDKDAKKKVFMKETFVLDYSHINELTDADDIDTARRQLKLISSLLKVKKGYHEFGFVVKFLNGSTEQKLTLEDLSDFERDMVDAGITTLEQIQKDRGMRSEYRNEVRLIRPLLSRYSTGVVERDDLTEDDFVVKVADPLADLFSNVEINDDEMPF